MGEKQRGSFSGKLGYVLAAAGASVGLGNIWRFPYLAAKYGGGVFILVYVLLVLTFGYTMIMAETTIGRISGKSPVGAFKHFSKDESNKIGGWLNAIIPLLIVSYYVVIGGWVCKYLYGFITGQKTQMSDPTYFDQFITNGKSTTFWFLVFTIVTMAIIFNGVQNGIERVSKFMMPVLVILAVIISIYAMTRDGAMEGVKYVFIPDPSRFSWAAVVAAMEQMFYSLSIAMGILITFGSYMKKDVSIEETTTQVEIFDTLIAILASLMIIPAVFAFYKEDAADMLQAGTGLMFKTMPKIFDSMSMGGAIGTLFFVLVLFAALTSAIALAESIVSTLEDEMHWGRKKSTLVTTILILVLGIFSALGYGPWAMLKIIGMQCLDFFDFISNGVMMPIAAMCTCLLVIRDVGLNRIAEEVMMDGMPFKRRKVFEFMIKYICPFFLAIILFCSVASTFGLIKI